MTRAATSTKLPKAERLYRRDHIQLLVQHSKRIYKGNCLMLRAYHFKDEPSDISKVLISVSKRRLPRANKRNRMKRLIREVYRLHKPKLVESTGFWGLHFIYLKNELTDYELLLVEAQQALVEAEIRCVVKV